jgi:hypothetical protein
MTAADRQDDEDAAAADAFFSILPSAGSSLARLGRAVLLFAIALALARMTPWTGGSAWTLALAVGLLSICTLTKWVATFGLAILLLFAILPPQVLGAFGRL